jgi:hypothetical protein
LSKVDQNLQFWTKRSQQKNKNEQYCAVRLFNFKVAETFCQFLVRDCRYFLPCMVNQRKQGQSFFYVPLNEASLH